MAIKKRKVDGVRISDSDFISNMSFNEKAGARKITEVGRKLIPLKSNATTFTTDASTARALPAAGKNIAVYNNSNAIKAVTFGEDGTITALAAGATDASGHVGLACPANSWSYFAAGESVYVIATDATTLVYLIDDDSYISQESAR